MDVEEQESSNINDTFEHFEAFTRTFFEIF